MRCSSAVRAGGAMIGLMIGAMIGPMIGTVPAPA